MSHGLRETSNQGQRGSSPLAEEHNIQRSPGPSGQHRDEIMMSEPSQEGRQGAVSNICPYISDIDTLAESYRTGAKSKFEVVSAVTQLLNEDSELSPQTRTQSFEVFLAEVEATKSHQRSGRGGRRVQPETSTGRDKLT